MFDAYHPKIFKIGVLMSEKAEKEDLINQLTKLREESYTRGFHDGLDSLRTALLALKVLGKPVGMEHLSIPDITIGIIDIIQEELSNVSAEDRERAMKVPPNENIH